MSHYLNHLVTRSLPRTQAIQPRSASLFEPLPKIAGSADSSAELQPQQDISQTESELTEFLEHKEASIVTRKPRPQLRVPQAQLPTPPPQTMVPPSSDRNPLLPQSGEPIPSPHPTITSGTVSSSRSAALAPQEKTSLRQVRYTSLNQSQDGTQMLREGDLSVQPPSQKSTSALGADPQSSSPLASPKPQASLPQQTDGEPPVQLPTDTSAAVDAPIAGSKPGEKAQERSLQPRQILHPLKVEQPPVPPSVPSPGANPPASTIQVTIGRVEVRAATPPPTARPKSRPTAPVMGLKDYLERRSQGGWG